MNNQDIMQKLILMGTIVALRLKRKKQQSEDNHTDEDNTKELKEALEIFLKYTKLSVNFFNKINSMTRSNINIDDKINAFKKIDEKLKAGTLQLSDNQVQLVFEAMLKTLTTLECAARQIKKTP